MHSELLVAYEVVLEPTARVAPYSTESFRSIVPLMLTSGSFA
jgi:hypothetical protein